MENQNTLKFEASINHNLLLRDRHCLEISGIRQIDSFDAHEFLIETVQGWLLVEGTELTLGKLDIEKGEVIIKGNINLMSYLANKKTSDKESILAKIFR